MDIVPLIMPAALQAGNEDLAKALLHNYFFVNDDRAPNEGALFNTVGHDWRNPPTRNVITPEDLVALSTLSVPVEARAVVEFQDGALQDEVTRLLVQIPIEVAIVDDDAWDLLGPGGAARVLWNRLNAVYGFGDARASKLLARKRPLLVPIYDSYVADVLRLRDSSNFWAPMRAALIDDDCAVYKRALKLRNELHLSDAITPLRVIDVVLWSVGAREASAKRAAARGAK